MADRNSFVLQQLMRWYGQNDPVKLEYIAQAGCSGVATALHAVPVGEIWEVGDIASRRAMIEQKHLSWKVVESLPVHEDIKTRKGNFPTYINNYQQSLVNLGRCGIEVVTYNFMPVLDWLRTDTNYKLPNEAEALFFNKDDYAVFDLFLLKRPGAEKDYSQEEIQRLEGRYAAMGHERRKRLFHNILLGLPGSNIPFTAGQVLDQLRQYDDIGRDQLKGHLIAFLEAVVPVAEEAGIRLAIHPDDPPFSVLGLPRIMCTDRDIEDVMTAVPGVANGLCFCTGSFGAREDNDVVAMIQKWGSRIFFLHLRNVRLDAQGNFIETNHLDGDTDMFDVMCEVVRLMHREERSIPMRPDHGHKILDDLNKRTYAGYSAIGRLKGLAELRGLELGVTRFLTQQGELAQTSES